MKGPQNGKKKGRGLGKCFLVKTDDAEVVDKHLRDLSACTSRAGKCLFSLSILFAPLGRVHFVKIEDTCRFYSHFRWASQQQKTRKKLLAWKCFFNCKKRASQVPWNECCCSFSVRRKATESNKKSCAWKLFVLHLHVCRHIPVQVAWMGCPYSSPCWYRKAWFLTLSLTSLMLTCLPESTSLPQLSSVSSCAVIIVPK